MTIPSWVILIRVIFLIVVCLSLRGVVKPRAEHITSEHDDQRRDEYVDTDLMYTIFSYAEYWLIFVYLDIIVPYVSGSALVRRWTSRGYAAPRLLGPSSDLLPELAAVAFCVAGCWLRQAACDELGRYFTYAVTIKADHELISTGPYALLVHPSYTGALLCFYGALFFSGFRSLRFWLITIPLSLAGMLVRIFNEEQVLAAQFGEKWISFYSSRYKLIPFIW